MLEQLDHGKLTELIKEYCPIVIHNLSKGRKHTIDYFTKIYTTPINAIYNGTPALYYNGWGKGETYYLLYGSFHRMDESHAYDFEGWCIKVVGQRAMGIITVCHYMLLYRDFARNAKNYTVTMNAGNHGIHPEALPTDNDHIIQPDAITFVPMYGNEWNDTLEQILKVFGNVKLPWQWNGLEGKYRIKSWAEHFLNDHLDGLIWYNPELLFKIVEQWDYSKRHLLPELKEYLEERKRQ